MELRRDAHSIAAGRSIMDCSEPTPQNQVQGGRALLEQTMEDALLEQLRRDAQIIPESILGGSESAPPHRGEASSAAAQPLQTLANEPQTLHQPEVAIPDAAPSIASTSAAADPIASTDTSDMRLPMLLENLVRNQSPANPTDVRSLSPRQSPRQVWASELPPSPRARSPRSPRGGRDPLAQTM